MKSLTTAVLSCALLLLSTGCDQGNERLDEKARIEGRASGEANVEVQNHNLAARAASMEADLIIRRRFIESVTGTYEGTLVDSQGRNVSARMTVTSSFPRYPATDRPRTVEELTYELSNLHLNIQVVEWVPMGTGPTDPEMAFGCIFENVRPNMTDGTLSIISEACRGSYILSAITSDTTDDDIRTSENRTETSRRIASEVLAGNRVVIDGFAGVKQSTLSSRHFLVRLVKVERL